MSTEYGIVSHGDWPILNPQFMQFQTWPFANCLPGPEDWGIVLSSHDFFIGEKRTVHYYGIQFMTIAKPENNPTYILREITALVYSDGKTSTTTNTINIHTTIALEEMAHNFITVATVMKNPERFLGDDYADNQPPIFLGMKKGAN